MVITSYSEKWAQAIADLFHQSVHAIDSNVYTAEQKEAWAPTPPDYKFWSRRLNNKKPFVAIMNERVAGFIELEPDGHIDCVYTHPDFQSHGVASALYEYLLMKAKCNGMQRLYVEASIIAKAFFVKRGFSVVKKNEIKCKGITLVNFTMEKNLSPD
ncbi:MAG: histone acetyltransferase [Gammaproteobacteria bacterium]|nr:MAG: histone acetyltransferase [Gammaproteobacteria bacterium]